jgi:DNA-directed RNA polymerase specialized sigma24 family protein
VVRPKDPIDASLCEALVGRITVGDRKAWEQLVGHLWPACVRIVASRSAMRQLGSSQDHVENVVTNLIGKLGDEDARGLRLYGPWRARNPDKSFDDWIRIVAANTVRDYVRDHANELAAVQSKEIGVKRLLNEFTTSAHAREYGAMKEVGERPAFTAAQTARQLLAYAKGHLPEEQHRALMLWIEGGGFDEIAGELGLGGAEAAQRLVRAAVAVLRRQFASEA